jgi:hypothetical protein
VGFTGTVRRGVSPWGFSGEDTPGGPTGEPHKLFPRFGSTRGVPGSGPKGVNRWGSSGLSWVWSPVGSPVGVVRGDFPGPVPLGVPLEGPHDDHTHVPRGRSSVGVSWEVHVELLPGGGHVGGPPEVSARGVLMEVPRSGPRRGPSVGLKGGYHRWGP